MLVTAFLRLHLRDFKYFMVQNKPFAIFCHSWIYFENENISADILLHAFPIYVIIY